MATTVEHWPNGNIKRMEVKDEDGKYHNPSGPAMQCWHENGQERVRSHWVHDNRQNLNGPAYQAWHKDGKVRRRAYWVDGKELTEAEFKALQDSVEVMYEGRTARISKTQAIELGLID